MCHERGGYASAAIARIAAELRCSRYDRAGTPAAIGQVTNGGTEPHVSKKEKRMLYWTAVFFAIALVAAVLGFTGIAGAAAGAAKILFFAFLIVAVISLLFHRRVPA